MFNEICINEEMLPKYTYIYIYKTCDWHATQVVIEHDSLIIYLQWKFRNIDLKFLSNINNPVYY